MKTDLPTPVPPSAYAAFAAANRKCLEAYSAFCASPGGATYRAWRAAELAETRALAAFAASGYAR